MSKWYVFPPNRIYSAYFPFRILSKSIYIEERRERREKKKRERKKKENS